MGACVIAKISLGQHIPVSECQTAAELARKIVPFHEAMGAPGLPAGPGEKTFEAVYYDPDTGELVTPSDDPIAGVGTPGADGARGLTGPTGAAGPAGPIGPIGAAGDDGSGGTAEVLAIILFDVPGSGVVSKDGVIQSVAMGRTVSAAMIVDTNGVLTGDVYDAINPSKTAYEIYDPPEEGGKDEDPHWMITSGHVIEESEGIFVFVIAWPDLRAVPGYDPAAAQWPLHQANSPDYTQIGGYDDTTIQIALQNKGDDAVWQEVIQESVLTDYVHETHLFNVVDAYLIFPTATSDTSIPTAEC